MVPRILRASSWGEHVYNGSREVESFGTDGEREREREREEAGRRSEGRHVPGSFMCSITQFIAASMPEFPV